MVSIKNLKSKHCAFFTDDLLVADNSSPTGVRSHVVSRNPDYDYRKRQFADSAPAKIVKPVRAISQRVRAELSRWERIVEQHAWFVKHGHTPVDGPLGYPYGWLRVLGIAIGASGKNSTITQAIAAKV